MEYELDEVEVRILGALIEKEMTTPDYYPLTLNSLCNACNQKSNRNPVMAFDEMTVARGLESLKKKRLVWQTDISRVPKYEESMTTNLDLEKKEAAVLCELFLRGPQTVGEIRGRAERMTPLADLQEVADILGYLEDVGYLKKLPRQPGRKESRYMHLFSGEPEFSEAAPEAKPEPATLAVRAENEKITQLQDQVEALSTELNELKKAFQDFKSQFE